MIGKIIVVVGNGITMARRIPTVGVLVVEDDDMVRSVAAEMIATSELKVYEAADANEAIFLLERHPDIQIVFTDVKMPGAMDGLRLAHYIRDRWPSIQLILSSGKMSVSDDEMPSGAAFISKPYTHDNVWTKVREMTERLSPSAL